MTGKLLFTQEGHVVTLTLNMPETRNALTDADLCDAIVEAIGHITSAAPLLPGRARHFLPAAISST